MKKALLISTVAAGVLAIGTCFFGQAKENETIKKNEARYEAMKEKDQPESTSTATTPSTTVTTSTTSTETTTKEKEANHNNKVETATYTIRTGDTLLGIASVCDISVDELLKLNHWDKEKELVAGDTFVVPKDKLAALQRVKHRISQVAKETKKEKQTTVTKTTETVASSTTTASTYSSVTTQTPAPSSVPQQQAPAPVTEPVQQAPVQQQPVQQQAPVTPVAPAAAPQPMQ